jgi:hypothetical protein
VLGLKFGGGIAANAVRLMKLVLIKADRRILFIGKISNLVELSIF